MELTWDEFLKLATIITNLNDSMNDLNDLFINIFIKYISIIEIEEKNRRIFAAAKDYLEFFDDFKYINFMTEVRIIMEKKDIYKKHNFKRPASDSEICKLEEEFESFLSNYFGTDYDEEDSDKWKPVIDEIRLYFEYGEVGGWSSYYCSVTWNDETLENDADLEIFDLLEKIDMKNGADSSKIVHVLCLDGAFEAVKVRKSLFYF